MIRRVCFPFIGDLYGGSYIGAMTLVDELDRRRYEPVIALHEEGRFAARLRASGTAYHVVAIPGFVGVGRGLLAHLMAIARSAPTIARFLRRERIALVHSNESPLQQTWATPVRLAGAKHIWHQRGRVSTSRLEALCRADAARCICVSQFILSQMPASIVPRCVLIDHPFETAAPGIDRGAMRRRLAAELTVDETTAVVGFFGNLLAVKRPEDFVDAAAAIARGHDGPVVFVMFGDDRENRASGLKQRAHAAGIGDALHIMGFREDAAGLIAGCDVMLAPSVGDPFPRTLVEASLAGVPVVAADAGGHPEFIEHGVTGLLVPPENAAAMAAAALELLADSDRAAALSAAAEDEARRRFSAERHARQVEAVYDAVLG